MKLRLIQQNDSSWEKEAVQFSTDLKAPLDEFKQPWADDITERIIDVEYADFAGFPKNSDLMRQ